MNTSTGNYWMDRVADSKNAERLADIIRTDDRRDNIIWAVQIIAVWLFGMAIVFYKTIYAATIQGAGPLAGLSAAIGFGLLVTGMVFAVWYRNR